MNMFKAFESRVASAFETTRGAAAPFSFRRLARRAARELEQETYVVDGVDMAPALFTILVSADDDAVMRPLYGRLTEEISDFVEAEAARKEYIFAGKPLARFMVDPSLRRGRFAVFANNVDALTLEKLREEEEAFLSGFGPITTAAPEAPEVIEYPEYPEYPDYPEAPEFSQMAVPLNSSDPIEVVSVDAPSPTDDSAIGLSVMPEEYIDDISRVSAPDPVVAEARALADALPEVADVEANPIVTPVPEVLGQQVPAVPEVLAAPAQIAVPAAVRHESPNTQDTNLGAAPTPVVEAEVEPVTCLLIDRQSGRTYLGTAPRTLIGRERTAGGIVLHDPNVSRRHAELTYDGSVWRVHDLGSTNGTLVNDVDIDSCVLRDGDLLTLGLLNLEFRES